MSNPALARPEPSEYYEYYGKYIQLVPESDVVQAMTLQVDETVAYLRSIPESAGDNRYAPGKWSIKEVIGHMTDIERVFGQRALFFARKSPGPLPGIEQDDWIRAATFGEQRLGDLISEFDLVRKSNIPLFRNLDADAWMRRGVASGREFTVRSVAYIIVGHERHHLEILKTRYFS